MLRLIAKLTERARQKAVAGESALKQVLDTQRVLLAYAFAMGLKGSLSTSVMALE